MGKVTYQLNRTVPILLLGERFIRHTSDEMLRMPITQPEQQHKAVNLTWVVVVLALVALLEGIQRGNIMISM